jgi:ABC-type antimicrobial peptide transport system permease subunit
LSLLATLAGALIGLAAGYYFQEVGLDLSKSGDISFAGVAFDPLWRALLTTGGVLKPVMEMWIICVLASLYPAILAAKLEPVKAMTHV